MNRIIAIAGLCCAALFLLGCTGAPPPGTEAPGTAGVGQTPQPAATDPLGQLCDAREPASLAGIATALERPDDEAADMTRLSESVTTAQANLEAAQVDQSVEAARNTAVAALAQLQEVLEDPQVRGPVRTSAAQALRALHGKVCDS